MFVCVCGQTKKTDRQIGSIDTRRCMHGQRKWYIQIQTDIGVYTQTDSIDAEVECRQKKGAREEV